MPSALTRRGFIHSATTAGVLSQATLASGPAAAQGTRRGAPLRRASFDAGWRFSRGDFPGAEVAGYDDAAWQQVDTPHDWSIFGPFDEKEPSGGNGGYLPTGMGWYRKRFTLTRSQAGKRVRLEFDGVYERSEVWINGQLLGMRPYGFISFGYDLTPHLNPPGKPNTVAVRVDNSLQPNCRWYSGSGIYRHVWLITTEPVHVAPWGVYVRTPAVDGERAAVEVDTQVVNDGTAPSRCTLVTEIHDPNGQTVQTASVTAVIAPGENHRFAQRLEVAKPVLWSLDTPALYSVHSRVESADGRSDIELTPFGIRTIAFDVNRGFLLNGRHVKLNGVCLHADGGAVGTAVPERVWEERLKTLKAMGCTAIRCSHCPPAPEFLDLCDRLGLLVMDEAFDEWRYSKGQTKFGYAKYFDEWGRRDLTDIIVRDRNHPSIVIWSAGNEIVDQTRPDGTATLSMLKEVIRGLDTRPVTAGCDNIAADPVSTPPQFLAELDVVGYNYVDRWHDRREKYYAIDRYDYPKRLFIGTESTSMGGPRGVYTPQPTRGARGENRRIDVEQLQKFIQTWDYVSGDFIWTGIDYIGEARWPNKSATSGVIDTCGFAKDGYYFYRSLWTDETVLHLFPHWNWAGREGETVRVRCYTNCDTVELFLNGVSLGTRGFAFPRPGMTDRYGVYPPRASALQTTADLHLEWDVPYAPGTLKAVGVRGDKPATTVEISTTGEPSAIRLIADRDHISTSAGDVSHVRVEVVDAQGRMVPTASNAISFALAGAGRLIGVDNGQPDSHESYKGQGIRAFNGLALALVQSRGRPGAMTLSATSPGLSGATIGIVAS